ncbi:MAG TPA: hypothetical protein VGM27_15500 [Acidobacteriaceae bacterium]|jgi:hypothetical protein
MQKQTTLLSLTALVFGLAGLQAQAQKDPMVGGAAMYPTTLTTSRAAL